MGLPMGCGQTLARFKRNSRQTAAVCYVMVGSRKHVPSPQGHAETYAETYDETSRGPICTGSVAGDAVRPWRTLSSRRDQ